MTILEYDDTEVIEPKVNQRLRLIDEIIKKTERNSPSYFRGRTYPYNDLYDKLHDRSLEELRGLLKLH